MTDKTPQSIGLRVRYAETDKMGVEVKTWGKLLSPARVEFVYEISRPADGTLNAIGRRTVHAAIDATGRPCRLPGYIRELLQ